MKSLKSLGFQLILQRNFELAENLARFPDFMSKFLLLFHTLKYLRWEQFYFRFRRKLIKPRVTDVYCGLAPLNSNDWVSAELYEEKITRDLCADFLNHRKKLNFPKDWNDESHSKLWVYNLHYFEDLLCIGSGEKQRFHIHLLDLWINQNPEGQGNGWEPYPLSLRISNILKAWLSGLSLEERHFRSLHAQASYLSNDLEKHLLGNHYFVNLKALLFAGVIFDNPRWLKIATSGLMQEIPEQILDDGANFELSPMYHSLILVDMLDMYNLCRSYYGKVDLGLVSMISGYLPKMIWFRDFVSLSDGEPSFFNDSVCGIAPSSQRINKYAEKLGFEINMSQQDELCANDTEASGFMVAQSSVAKLIFDAGDVGPDYIPGHAHADTLSFELSILQERVFVNTGISQYGLGGVRLNQRKTRAHNTVEVDNSDSSQVWSGFRVAKRARVIKRFCNVENNVAILSAEHNGFKQILGGPIHSRIMCFSGGGLKVIDRLNGRFNCAVARFYFHPDLSVNLQNNFLSVMGKGFEMTANLNGQKSRILDSTWCPEFGLRIPNVCLEIDFIGPELATKFHWNVK